jgi:hypothetical protein
MATAAPFVKLLRQLATAKDDYRTGALDITWDGGKATLFLVFGQPNHAVFDNAGGQHLEGTEALAALVYQLPPRFQLSPWRKEVVRTDTLRCTLEDVMEPFAQMAGAASPGPVAPTRPDTTPLVMEAAVKRPDFGLADFPLLPLGPSLWADASAGVVHLDLLLPSLPDALVVLTGPKLRAAGVVVRHQLIDAVWVEEADRTIGETAAMALMGARQGSVSGYRLENPRLGEALTMLWRCPAVYREMPASWVNSDSLLMDLEGRNGDAAILISGGVHGVALVAGGALVGVYTETERQPVASLERLAALLRAPGARVTLRQNPEEMPVDQMPETAYHAFVEAAAEPPTPLREPFAARPAPVRTGIEPSSTIPAAGSAPAPAAPPPPLGEAEAEPAAWTGPPEPEPEIWTAPPPGTFTAPAWSGTPVGTDGPAAAPADPTAPPQIAASGGPDLRAGTTTSSAPFLAVVPGEPPPPDEPEGPAAPTGEPAGGPEAGVWSPSPLDDLDEVAAPLAPWSGVYQAPPAAGEGASGPAQFAEFAASQGMDDLAAPTPGPDFDTVKADLIQIGALWLGTDGVGPVAEMLQRARPTIADVMAAIDSIKNVVLPGFEPSVVQAMAREMYYHAAEYLSGL